MRGTTSKPDSLKSRCHACGIVRTVAADELGLGFVWIETRPFLRPSRSKTGSRISAPRTEISSKSCQVISSSVQVGLAAISSRIRSSQRWSSFFSTSPTIVGLLVAPVAPRSTAYVSSSTDEESFQ
jgi:hypothetical protein